MRKVFNRHTSYLKNILDTTTDSDLITLEKTFFNWEAKYEKRCKITPSNIFRLLTHFVEEYGTPLKCEAKYLKESYNYKDYNFSLYIGHGSFWRITKNGVTIFQTK
jgi:hypothetical protein